ncbi:HWE histidine kinase domain-containing protein [Aurantimonas sp. VKM B-3413]|uniref:HWE histidine kinase domain-containing protein n=1 Tax=Aurantimonas sp. VKM B-3413 TaxID=2779401 RepID=UPI001E45934F|nr:HWE histidine kinase domain-containing protein [Aurantimonas sp. VKM B-3413]MCB8838283.1 GAF domain-containing protein [Aurantimonas sp. VKM B-3413]
MNHLPPSSDPARSWTESERSARLVEYGILDTPRESDFDDLAEIAAEVCDTPIAVVNFVDSARQFFKAEVGLGVRETPLATSFCGHAILADDMMIVPDATKDKRFEGNPLVAEGPKLRFYAGAILKTRDGVPLGTMCVLDYRPRTLSEHQIRTLKLLAREAMTQLELRRTLAEKDRALAQAQALAADLHETQQRQLDITHELSHRMKNSLAMVQAIVSQSLRRVTSIGDARRTISERLAALGRAQDILVRPGSSTIGIGEVVEIALGPHRSGEGRFRIEGDDRIELTAQQALGLSLGLHELATNAMKYGALSSECGRVDIHWSNGKDQFRFEWAESGGPPVTQPPQLGFGSQLMERIVAPYFDGVSQLSFDPAGLRFTLEGGAIGEASVEGG